MPDSPSARTPAAHRPPPDPSTPKGWTLHEERGADLIGLVLGERFRLLERIGRGGMGSVFVAEDLALRSRAAVKLLRTDDPDARRRFLEEATILANLRNPHLVQVLAVGEADDGTPFMAMEHLGQSLETRLQRSGGPLPWREVVDLAAQVALALATLHRAGVIHRDVKPSNIAELRGATGRPLVKLIDLGIARVEDWTRVQAGGPDLPPRAPTRVGKVIGTPGFVPPESSRCHADARFDVFGLGVTIYKLITGAMPDPEALRPMREARPSLDVPDDLEALVAASVAADPEQRIASAEDLARRLSAIRTVHAVAAEPALFDGCYELLEILGVGAHAEVHRAYNRVTRRYVALKILRPEVRGDSRARRRLDREARALAALDHPNIPALLDGRTDAEARRPFIAMEVATGARASEFCLQETRLSPRAVVAVGLQLLAGLEAMHERGLLHRDLHAGNVLIEVRGDSVDAPTATLIDLGMVALEERFYAVVSERYPTPLEARKRPDDAGLELLEWTAPEARAGEGWTGRSDVYSLGLLLFRLLTGKRPTKDEGGAWISPDELVGECPRPLGYAILGALEEDPTLRLDAKGLREALVEVAAEMDGEEEMPATSADREVVAPLAHRRARESAGVLLSPRTGPRWWSFIAGFAVAMLLVLAWGLGRESGLREGTGAIPAKAVDQSPRSNDVVVPEQATHVPARVVEETEPHADDATPERAQPESSAIPPAPLPKTSLSRGAFRERVATRSSDLDACMRGSPPVSVKMTIEATGRVARIDIDGASPMVDLCVRDVLQSIAFPVADRRSTHRLALGGP